MTYCVLLSTLKGIAAISYFYMETKALHKNIYIAVEISSKVYFNWNILTLMKRLLSKLSEKFQLLFFL